jgi:hypothetical protein
LFEGSKAWRELNGMGLGEERSPRSSTSKIDEIGNSVWRNQNVCWLDVAVEDLKFVEMVQGIKKESHPTCNLFFRESAVPLKHGGEGD